MEQWGHRRSLDQTGGRCAPRAAAAKRPPRGPAARAGPWPPPPTPCAPGVGDAPKDLKVSLWEEQGQSWLAGNPQSNPLTHWLNWAPTLTVLLPLDQWLEKDCLKPMGWLLEYHLLKHRRWLFVGYIFYYYNRSDKPICGVDRPIFLDSKKKDGI